MAWARPCSIRTPWVRHETMEDRDPDQAPASVDPNGWQALLWAELRASAVRRPWGRAVMAIGVVHLAFFVVCQAVYTAGVRVEWPSLLLWSSEVAAVLATLRLVAGRAWFR